MGQGWGEKRGGRLHGRSRRKEREGDGNVIIFLSQINNNQKLPFSAANRTLDFQQQNVNGEKKREPKVSFSLLCRNSLQAAAVIFPSSLSPTLLFWFLVSLDPSRQNRKRWRCMSQQAPGFMPGSLGSVISFNLCFSPMRLVNFPRLAPLPKVTQ